MINNILLKLSVEKNQNIIISSQDQIITAYSYGDVFFKKNNQLYQIYGEFPLQIFLLTLKKLLTKSLFGSLSLHPSINHDIGYLWNQRGNDPTFISIKYTDQNNDTYWIGQKYELSCYNYVAWIYNDNNGNIILKITPAYPRCINQENAEEVEHYQKWMQKYQPADTTIISPEKVEQWLLEIQPILETIIKNTQALNEQE